MSGPLLDASVLIAATFPEHEQFDLADEWLASQPEFAVCPITEGALVRFALRVGVPGPAVAELLQGVHATPACRFVEDSLSYRSVDVAALRGHRQVTDAYLLQLARRLGRRLATFDHALAAFDVDATVIPSRRGRESVGLT